MTSPTGTTSVLMRHTKSELADEVTALRGRISDLEKTEDTLRDVEERYVLVNQATRDALFEWDLETDQIYFPTDEREALGLLGWDTTGRGWVERTHPDDEEAVRAQFIAGMKGEEERFSAEYRLKDDAGNWRWVHTMGVFQCGPDGKAVRMIGSTADITDRKQAEEELRKLNEELELRVEQRTTELVLAKVAAEEAGQVKSNFLLAMSHELRTPVNQIIGYSELLAEDAADAGQENLVPDLEKIRIAGQGLLAMIINVLDLSDLETGAMKLAIEEFDLTALIADVETTATPLMGANRNTFTVVTGSEIGTMQSDPAKVRRCLDSLLSNAAKFTEAGRVQLRVGSSGDDRIAFSVTDNGIGMTPEQRANLFQAFIQVEVGATRSHDGAGLGLAITQRFCAMLGGEVSVESEPGKGSIFTITLPASFPAID